jgi:Ca2+-binding EF-hand superfamily protein
LLVRCAGWKWSELFSRERSTAEGLRALLTCDGQTLTTNLLGQLAAGCVWVCLGAPVLSPHLCLGWGVACLLGLLLNIWHQFVVVAHAGVDPSGIDLWLATIGLLLGGVLLRPWHWLFVNVCCWCCPSFEISYADRRKIKMHYQRQKLGLSGVSTPAQPVSQPLSVPDLQAIRLRRMFEMADKDRSGFLDEAELAHLARRLLPASDGMTDRRIESMVAAADKDGDGQISYEEFIAVVTEGLRESIRKKRAEVAELPVSARGVEPEEEALHREGAAEDFAVFAVAEPPPPPPPPPPTATAAALDDNDANAANANGGHNPPPPRPPPFLASALGRLEALGAWRMAGLWGAAAAAEDAERTERAWTVLTAASAEGAPSLVAGDSQSHGGGGGGGGRRRGWADVEDAELVVWLLARWLCAHPTISAGAALWRRPAVLQLQWLGTGEGQEQPLDDPPGAAHRGDGVSPAPSELAEEVVLLLGTEPAAAAAPRGGAGGAPSLRAVVHGLQRIVASPTAGADATALAAQFVPLLIHRPRGAEVAEQAVREHRLLRALILHLIPQPDASAASSGGAGEAGDVATRQEHRALLAPFEALDTEGGGYLAAESWKRCIYAQLPEPLGDGSAAEVERLLAAAPRDANGKLGYLELGPFLAAHRRSAEPAPADNAGSRSGDDAVVPEEAAPPPPPPPPPEPEVSAGQDGEDGGDAGAGGTPLDGSGLGLLSPGGKRRSGSPPPEPSERWRSLFRRFDRVGKGWIGPRQLQRGWQKYMRQRITKAETLKMFAAADVDGDGKVDYREFAVMLEQGLDAQKQDSARVLAEELSQSTVDHTPAKSHYSESSWGDTSRVSFAASPSPDRAASAPEPEPEEAPPTQLSGSRAEGPVPGPSPGSATAAAAAAAAAAGRAEPSLASQVHALTGEVQRMARALARDLPPSGQGRPPSLPPPAAASTEQQQVLRTYRRDGSVVPLPGIVADDPEFREFQPAKAMKLAPLRRDGGAMKGLGGALLAVKDKQQAEAMHLTTFQQMIESSLLGMEQRIEQRISNIEANLHPGRHSQAAAGKTVLHELRDSEGLDEEDLEPMGSADVEAKLAALEQSLKLYRGYLGEQHPTIVSLMDQLRTTAEAAGRYRDARRWQQTRNDAARDEERDAELPSFCDGMSKMGGLFEPETTVDSPELVGP